MPRQIYILPWYGIRSSEDDRERKQHERVGSQRIFEAMKTKTLSTEQREERDAQCISFMLATKLLWRRL